MEDSYTQDIWHGKGDLEDKEAKHDDKAWDEWAKWPILWSFVVYGLMESRNHWEQP